MVGVINPNENFTLDIQKQYVRNSTFEFAPGQPFPTEKLRPDPKVPGGYMPTAPSSTGSHSSSKHESMAGTLVAGIAVGAVALLGLIVALLFVYYRKQCTDSKRWVRRRQQQGMITLRSAPSPPQSWQARSEGLLFACQGERETSSSASRTGTPGEGDAAAGGRRMSPVQEREEEVVAYSSPGVPYYGIISPMRDKPGYYPRKHGATYSMSNNQYHPTAPIMLAASSMPVSSDPGNSPLPRCYYYDSWSRPFSWRRGVDSYNDQPDKVGGGNMI